ncbi:hypothetical protein ABIB24_001118 [Pseudomonas sp. UYEF17]
MPAEDQSTNQSAIPEVTPIENELNKEDIHAVPARPEYAHHH